MAGLEATPPASRWVGEGAPWLSTDMLAQSVRNHAIPEGHRFEVSFAVSFPGKLYDDNFPQTWRWYNLHDNPGQRVLFQPFIQARDYQF